MVEAALFEVTFDDGIVVKAVLVEAVVIEGAEVEAAVVVMPVVDAVVDVIFVVTTSTGDLADLMRSEVLLVEFAATAI